RACVNTSIRFWSINSTARGPVLILSKKISIDGPGEKDKIDVASIYKQSGNDVRILIAGEDRMAIPKSASSRRQGARILIADENPATLEFFSRLLEDRGFATLTADSGEAVLKFLFQEDFCSEIYSGNVVMRAAVDPPIDAILLGDL